MLKKTFFYYIMLSLFIFITIYLFKGFYPAIFLLLGSWCFFTPQLYSVFFIFRKKNKVVENVSYLKKIEVIKILFVLISLSILFFLAKDYTGFIMSGFILAIILNIFISFTYVSINKKKEL